MIKEAYCSYEVSKLLKEKGFDEECTHYYSCEDDELIEYTNGVYSRNSKDCHRCTSPTHQMAMAWLREVHNIIIVIEPHMHDYINEKTSSYVTSLWQGDNYYENITLKDYSTYEEAVEATLKYVLEKLI